MTSNESLMIAALALSVKGAAHVKGNLPNQDSVMAYLEGAFAGIAVADGLGSCYRSHEGSQLAVEVAMDVTKAYLAGLPGNKGDIAVADFVLSRWQERLPEGNTHDFDTTLLFAGFYKGTVLVGGIGDGMIQVSTSGLPGVEVLPERSGFANQTDSLASCGASMRFKLKTLDIRDSDLPLVIVLATDGVSDDIDARMRSQLTLAIGETIMKGDLEAAEREFERWLENWPAPGNTDDKSIAVMTVWDRRDAYV